MDENRSLGLWLKFAGVSLHVCFRAGEEQDVYMQAKSVILDGKRMEGNVIPRDVLQAVKAEREILVNL